jgi:hypothetical protein
MRFTAATPGTALHGYKKGSRNDAGPANTYKIFMERQLEESGSDALSLIVVAELEGGQGCQTGSNAPGLFLPPPALLIRSGRSYANTLTINQLRLLIDHRKKWDYHRIMNKRKDCS